MLNSPQRGKCNPEQLKGVTSVLSSSVHRVKGVTSVLSSSMHRVATNCKYETAVQAQAALQHTFMTTQLPAAKAGPIFHAAIRIGKFHGMI